MSVYKTDAAAEVKARPFLKVFAQQLLTAKARPVTQGYGALDSAFSADLQEGSRGAVDVAAPRLTPRRQAATPRYGQALIAVRNDRAAPGGDVRRAPFGVSAVRDAWAGMRCPTYFCRTGSRSSTSIFSVYPIYRQFDISFYNWHIFPGASNPSVGFSNYATSSTTRSSGQRH